jgi:hypothetical protein
MKASTKRRAGLALVTGATAIGLTVASGPASAQYNVGTGPVKIKIKMKGKQPVFAGPKRISQGEKLTIVNNTSPRAIGPHTFTLIKKAALPQGKKEFKACENFELKVCRRIIKAHRVNLDTGAVGRPNVDVGKKGWDKSFGKKGDSWVTEAKGDSRGRRAVAPVGKTLTYFCAVHPFMQGKIKVVE